MMTFADLGKPPEDELDRQEWFSKALALATHQAIVDPELSDKDRRQEIRANARAAGSLVSKVRIRKAEKTIREAADRMRQTQVDPTLEKAPAPKPSPPPVVTADADLEPAPSRGDAS